MAWKVIERRIGKAGPRKGREVVDIGSWNGETSHAISTRLSPLRISVIGDPKMTLEQFWQEKKCLAVWQDEE